MIKETITTGVNLTDIQKKAINRILDLFTIGITPICALDMGVGKTRIACKIIQKIINKNTSSRILIIHKASQYDDPWRKELLLNNYSKYHIYIHGKDRNKYLVKNKYIFPSYVNIFMTSYETARIDIENNKYDLSKPFDLIIFDEIHTIINHKKLTLTSRSLNLLKAKNKLAITGTPIQNSPDDLGLLYIFLKENKIFKKIINLEDGISEIADNNSEESKLIQDEKKIIFKEGIKKCKEDEAILLYFEHERKFIKKSIILSLPINSEMLMYITFNLKGNTKKQLMYMSHPASIYYLASRNQEFPYCTKAIAVELILKSMLTDEKAIIFSQFIDVLHIYSDICNNLGFSTIIVTGSDKGNKLEDKIHRFENISQNRVLLTTLQKASEGFNFNFATHIIILEFWWNPQKIFQAMSRIDRKSQTRNIFIYLLCYNLNGNMVKEEYKIYDKMSNKSIDASDTFEFISDKNKFIDNRTGMYNRKLPNIETFFEIQTFPEDLSKYLNNFHVTTKIAKEKFHEIVGQPIDLTRIHMEEIIKSYLEYFNFLFNYPWRLSYQEVFDYFNKLLFERLDENLMTKIENDIKNYPKKQFGMQMNIPEYYPFIFIKYFRFKFLNDSDFEALYIIGKKNNGKYDLLHIQDIVINKYDDLFKSLRNIGVKKIDTIILYDNGLQQSNVKIIKDIINKHFPYADCYMCITYFFQNLKVKGLDTENGYYLEKIFFSPSENSARSLLKNIHEQWTRQKHFAEMALKSFHLISHIYKYPLEKRMVVSSTNIIDYIFTIVQILIFNNNYKDINIIKYEIENISRAVLENCPKIYPFWDKLTIPI